MQAQPVADRHQRPMAVDPVEQLGSPTGLREETGASVIHGRGWLVRRALLVADLVGLIASLFLAQALFTAPRHAPRASDAESRSGCSS